MAKGPDQERRGTIPEIAVVDPAPEIVFADGYEELFQYDLKLLTLRRPNPKYDFKPGTVITAHLTDAEDVRLVVVVNETRKLEDYSQFELLFDGFADHEDAIETMRRIYPDTSYDSPMQAIFIMREDQWLSLTQEERDDLLSLGLDAINDIDQPHRAVTWPVLCFWVLQKLCWDMSNCLPFWIQFLRDNDLITLSEARKLESEWSRMSAEELGDILRDPGSDDFKHFVLLEGLIAEID